MEASHTSLETFIHSPILDFILIRVVVDLEDIPGRQDMGRENTLDGLPVHSKAPFMHIRAYY